MGLSPPFGDIGLLNSLAVRESLTTKEKIKIAGKDIGETTEELYAFT